MKETIVIIGKEVYKKLPAKEKKEFYHFERYKRMYERETGKNGDWVGVMPLIIWMTYVSFLV